jgi:hypothetical protein
MVKKIASVISALLVLAATILVAPTAANAEIVKSPRTNRCC